MPSTTRQPHIKKYKACSTCSSNTAGFGTCSQGYDNFYYRKSKDNHCALCQKQMHDDYMDDIFRRAFSN